METTENTTNCWNARNVRGGCEQNVINTQADGVEFQKRSEQATKRRENLRGNASAIDLYIRNSREMWDT